MAKLFSIFLVLVLSSCGYSHGLIFGSKKAKVTFTSYPDNADVIIFGVNKGKTPLTLELEATGYYDGVVVKEGYSNRNFRLNRVGLKNGWCVADTFGYFLIVPLISASSDYCATLSPNILFATLDKGERKNIRISE